MPRPKRQKNWILKNKGRPETTRSKEDRQEEIRDNQLASKILFEELFQDSPTDFSQLFMYKREVRGDGEVFIPRRVNLNLIREFFFPACFDEGDPFSTYLPENEYDEGDETDQILEAEWTEGGASFVPIICPDSIGGGPGFITSQPIVSLSSDSTLSERRYYRITGGTTFTITAASGVFNAQSPFTMTIKNASGGLITVNPTGIDTFYNVGGIISTFNLSDGDTATLIATTSSNYDIEIN